MCRVGLRGDSAWRATLRGSYTDALNRDGSRQTNPNYGRQMRLVPRETASVEFGYATERLSVTLREFWTGESFTRTDNRDALPPYALTDLFAVARFGAGADYTLRAAVRNLTDTQYEIVPQYPLPGRSFHLELGIEL